MCTKIKSRKFVYKNQDSLKKMHAFYDKTLAPDVIGMPGKSALTEISAARKTNTDFGLMKF